MKIAVCIRGELRTWFKAKDNIFSMFPKDADYFFTTWNKVHNPYLEKVEYPDINEITESFKDRNLVEIKVLPLKIDNSIIADKISLLMATQMFECNMLKKKNELKHSFVYDYVFCIRPDVIYFRKPFTVDEIKSVSQDPWVLESDGCFSSANSFGGLYSPDLFLGGQSSTMDIVSDYYFYLKAEHNRNYLYTYDTTHNTFAEHLHNCRFVLSNKLISRDKLEILRPHVTDIDVTDISESNKQYIHATSKDWYVIDDGSVYKFLNEELDQ